MLTFLRRLWRLVRRDRHAADLEEEMRLHMQLRAESLEKQGLAAADARVEARRQFGNVTSMEERSHDMWGFGSLDALRQDLRFAARRLRQAPAMSVPTIVVLALGIGATTAVFSAVDAALLRPLPFTRPEELVTLTNVNLPFEEERSEPNPLIGIEEIRATRRLFSGAAAFASGGLNLADPDAPRRVNAGVVTSDFFQTLGVLPRVGRPFTEEEGKPRGPAAAILSHRLWQQQFGGRDVVGRAVTLNGKSYTVVGIMPAGFNFPRESELWIPLSVPTTFETFAPFRGWLPSRVIARLAPGVSREFAAAQLLARWEQNLARDTLGSRSAFPEYVAEIRKLGAAVPLQRDLAGDRRQPLAILTGATVLLLLIACANVANLMLTDAARRRREVALRQVLGATRRRVVRQLLAEAMLLSVVGALLGLMLAPAALALLRALLPADLAGVAPARVDARVLAFATTLALATGIASGLWPALNASREDASDVIKSGGGHGSTAGRVGRVRRGLVIAELALTVTLLVGAGLMLRSFEKVMAEDLGMDPARVATLEMSFASTRGAATERGRVVGAVLDRLRRQPGVEAAGVVNDLPLRGGGGISVTVQVDGTPAAHSMDDMKFARRLMADEGYFRAMGIALVRGRSFTAQDDSAARVAVISSAMARAYWPGMDPLGRTFRFRPTDTTAITVVGIVSDVRERSLERDAGPQMYFPIGRSMPDNIAIVARGTLPPATLLARLRDAVHQVDRGQPVYNVRMMEDVIGNSVEQRRTNTALIAIFAGLALLLAALGVYAVVAFGVSQRSREFGIRSALGATAADLLALVSAEMVLVVLAGVVLGLGGAWALSRVLATLLYGVDVHDTTTFVSVPLVLIVPALVATLVPAWRATRVNPTEVMRAD